MTEDQRDDVAVSAFVERFSSVLVDVGWQRMPARVFVTLLASESAALTAADLAERLQVSPAAISGAVRAEEAVHLAGVDGQVKAVQGLGAAERLVQSGHGDRASHVRTVH